MPEPNSTVVVGALAGAGLGIGGGVVLGAHIDALVAGLFAAALASYWLDSINDRLKAGAAFLLASLFAGYGSSAAADWVLANVHGFTDSASLRMPIALCIGALIPLLVPIGVNRLKKLIGGAQ